MRDAPGSAVGGDAAGALGAFAWEGAGSFATCVAVGGTDWTTAGVVVVVVVVVFVVVVLALAAGALVTVVCPGEILCGWCWFFRGILPGRDAWDLPPRLEGARVRVGGLVLV